MALRTVDTMNVAAYSYRLMQISRQIVCCCCSCCCCCRQSHISGLRLLRT